MAERSQANSSKKRNKNTKHRQVSAVDVGSQDNDVEPEQQQLSFEVELAWCIQQLELVLHKDVPPRQGAEAVRVLKVLKNPKAALVKKRHAMRTTFGDYRKKMQEEEKMFASSARNIVLRRADKKKHDKASFLRKCVSHAPADTVTPPTTSEIPPVTSSLTPEECSSESTAQMQNAQQFIDNKAACFKFNFSVSDAVTDCSANDGGTSAGDCGASAGDGGASASGHHCAVKTLPSDNSFRFNFTSAQNDNPLKNKT